MKQLLTLTLITAALLGGFQNCSNVQFMKLDDSAVKSADTNEIIRSLQPSLAVRGIGCISCHAQVASTVISDFGYGSSYFMGQQRASGSWNSGTPYGDHGNSMSQMKMSADQKMIVPKVAVTSEVSNATGSTTLAAYVSMQFAQSQAVSTQQVEVKEVDSVYIGAPTDDALIAAFKLLPNERFKFMKHKGGVANLSGLIDEGTYFSTSGTLVCEGDLVVRGPLYLNHLKLQTVEGCRLYVIGSVFIYGGIEYANTDATRNLQISSSRAIALGLGSEKKAGAHCDTSSRWAKNTSDPSYSSASSLTTFFTDIWTTSNSYLRSGVDPLANGRNILDEARLIEAKTGPLYDASCASEGREIAFERILLNAPLVFSRYSAGVRGTIIAEYALMSIGSFKFEYDPVFNGVNVLPYLDRASILDVK